MIGDFIYVSIVGAGPAGCTAGIFLARNGFDVKLYEQDTERVKPCGGALSSRTIMEFKEFLKDIPFYEIKNVTFDLEGEIFDLKFNKKVGCVVDRFIFDKNLRNIAKSEGVKIIKKKVKKFPKNVICVDARGYKKSTDPAIAIRGFCKIKRQNMFFGFRRKIVKFGYFWIFPISDSLANVGVGGKIRSFNTNPLDTFNWFLKEKKLKASNVSGAPVYYEGKIENLVNGNIIKVGESAGLVNPLIGEGIYYGMKSGKIAANCIVNNEIKNYEKIVKNEFEGEFQKSLFVRSFFVNSPMLISKIIFNLWIKHITSKVLGL